jgi:hypothetical protein
MRAQNEAKQREIPELARVEHAAMTERKDRVITNWTTTRETTVCGLRCGYRGPLDTHKQAIHTEGYAAVARALLNARKQLAQQTRDGRKAVRDMRNSSLAQVRSEQRAARTRLTGEARATLTGMRSETQAAIGGMAAAARASIGGYPRNAGRLEDMLRRAAERGPAALSMTARQAPTNLTRTMLQVHRQQSERVASSGLRLSTNVNGRIEKQSEGFREQFVQAAVALNQATQDAAAQMIKSATSYTEAFGGLSESITQAAESWAAPLEQHFAGYLVQSRADAAAKLQTLLTGAVDTSAGGGGQGTGAATPAAGGPGATRQVAG